jgi:hypothetical protein
VPENMTSQKWVLANKQDAARPLIRARLVASEVKKIKGKDMEHFAATPPLELPRFILSALACERRHGFTLCDGRKAHLNGFDRRAVTVRSPPEASDGSGLLRRSMHGTHDAASCRE